MTESDDLKKRLFNCCGSTNWVASMAPLFPFKDKTSLFQKAQDIWHELTPQDWREAFSHHPKIGDLKGLRTRFAETRQLASAEQSGVEGASEEVLQKLAQGNRAYEEKFGYLFIVCASNKTAEQMLTLLNRRLENDPDVEIKIAMEEQAKITRIRLEKLFLGDAS